MNKWIGIGRITKKPELNYTTNQTAVTKFTIAIDRPNRDDDADFITITAFGKRAEAICRYMDKGRQIAVLGHIQTGSYKNRDGRMVYTTDIILDDDEFIGSAQPTAQPAQQIEETVNNMFGVDSFQSATDDIPF